MPDDLEDPRWHVPQVARRSDGRWGVFCASCSHHRGDYVNPCMKFPQPEWPPTLLKEDWPLPPALWWLEVKRSSLLVIAYANVLNGSVVYKTFYTLTKRGARRRAERWLRTTRKENR